MKRISVIIGMLLVLFAQPGSALAAEPEILTIAGTGDSQFLLQKLADDFNKAHPEIRVLVPNSVGSTGGIRALLAGEIRLARTARPLKEKEQGQGLVEVRFAYSPIAFVTHPSVEGIDNLTSAQIIGIYSGQYGRWSELGGPDAKIYPVDREIGDSSRTVLEKRLPGFRDIHSRGKIFYNTPDAANAIASHSFTVGFLPLNIASYAGLKVLRIDGKSPRKYVTSGSAYPYIVPFFMVSRGEPAGPALQFLRFLSTEKTRHRLQAENVRPAR
jgi:phosphate transport system substrate-binding protein